MDKNHLIGFWKESCGEGFPSLSEAPRDQLDPVLKERVIAYLQQCPMWIASPGPVFSPLDKGAVVGTASVRTDGKWAWQETMAHYVAQHQFALPPEFLRDLELRKYQAPTEQEVDTTVLDFPEI